MYTLQRYLTWQKNKTRSLIKLVQILHIYKYMDNISYGNGKQKFPDWTHTTFVNQQMYHLTINLFLLCWNMWVDVERIVVSFILLSLPVSPHPITHLGSSNRAKHLELHKVWVSISNKDPGQIHFNIHESQNQWT